MSQQKKYILNFNLESEDKNKLIKNKINQDIFIIENKRKISEELKINSDNIILTALDYNNLIFNLLIINEGKINFKDVKELEKKLNLKKIKEKPLIESLQVSEKILDPKWNRRKWISGETRGGENYIPPENWEGIALKVENEYDNGNNDWLGYDNKKENEYSIAYYGLNNDLEDKNVNISEYNVHANKIKELIKDDFYQDQIDERNKNQKCGEGLCLYQDPIWAENTARIIDIPGYNISIKVLLMCRVKPNKIRQPKNFPGCWILNPTPDEIRPYRILFKKVIKSCLGAQLKLSVNPEDFIINILKSKNIIFYKLAKDKNYQDMAYINQQKLSNDFFVLRFYTSDYYRYINNYLRDKIVDKFTEKQIQSFAYCLQLALSRNKGVKENTIVYRGINKFKFPEEYVKGTKFYFKEFMSTSVNINVARKFLDNNGTFLEIKLKNINEHSNYCYDVQKISLFPNEEEIIISSHCYFIIEEIKRGDFDYVRLTCEGFIN